jgi:hypothetical protein
MTLLFIKRLSYAFEENAENLVKEGRVKRKLMRIKRDIIFSFLKKQDGLSFLKHQRISVKR